MKICILGSGSSGNSIYIAVDGFSFLIDAGLSGSDLRRRLTSIGSSLSDIRAILISHEHHDHIRGLAVLCKKHAVPIYANRLTAAAIMEKGVPAQFLRFFKTGRDFPLGPVTVRPFPVPHDASDPVGFVVSEGDCRAGIATDLGCAPGDLAETLRGCRALVVESNHDRDLLNNGTRPLALKERIRGDRGHLSNETAAELLAGVASDDLRDIFLAHLSEECNRPEMARMSTERALRGAGFGHIAVRLTYADRVSDVVEYSPERSEACVVGEGMPCGEIVIADDN